MTDNATKSSPQSQKASMINRRYREIREIGRGGMGTVSLVEDSHLDNRTLALKRVRRDRLDSSAMETVINEFLAVSTLVHPNVARVYDFGTDSSNGDVFFTSEYVDGVNWLEFCNSLDLGNAGCDAMRRIIPPIVEQVGETFKLSGTRFDDLAHDSVFQAPPATG